MRGYLQRLVAAREAAVAARPAMPSRSPIAEADQRLGVGAVADAVQAFALESAPDAPAERIGESRTTPSYKTQGTATPRVPARSTPPATVSRYAMPLPAAASAMAPAAPQAATTPIAVAAEPARVQEGRAPLPPPVVTSTPARMEAVPAPRDAGARPLPFPEMRVAPIERPPAAEKPRGPETSAPELAPEPARPVAAEQVDQRVVPDAPQASRPLPSPRDRAAESDIRLPPVRPAGEIALTDAEPAHAPKAPRERIIIRETIRTPAETQLPKPQSPQPKAPRTAAEASVIGPLPRPELSRARVDLWLR